MSDAPRLIASSSTLLTNFTIGVSSALLVSTPPSSPISSLPASRSRFSRPSSSPPIEASESAPARACSIRRSSWSSGTMIGSTEWLVLNLISSSARRLVGSDTPTNRRLPRLNSGRALCAWMSFSSTSLTGAFLRSSARASNSGMPNSLAAAAATTPADASPFCTRKLTRGIFWRAAASAALRASSSPRAPSMTSRRAMPLRPVRVAGFICMAASVPRCPFGREMYPIQGLERTGYSPV